jgi:hypothetical protein
MTVEITRFYKQKGWIPGLITGLGMFLHAVFILGSMYFIIPEIVGYFQGQTMLDAIILSTCYFMWMIAIVCSVPLIAGALFVNAFPEIRCSEKGLETRVYKIFITTFPWEELNEIIEAPHNIKAVVIKRRGLNLVNGLYSNQIYGHNVKSKFPVLLLAPGLENRDEIINFIEFNNSNQNTP